MHDHARSFSHCVTFLIPNALINEIGNSTDEKIQLIH